MSILNFTNLTAKWARRNKKAAFDPQHGRRLHLRGDGYGRKFHRGKERIPIKSPTTITRRNAQRARESIYEIEDYLKRNQS